MADLSNLWKKSFNHKKRADGSQLSMSQMPGVQHIELNLHDIDQLFNTMDPSPFHDKDLDHDAEEFIVSWAKEFHRHQRIDLIVYLEKFPIGHDAGRLVEQAVHHYFAYRRRMNQLEFKRLMKQGRMSLIVGLCFLGLCLLIIKLLALNSRETIPNFFSQSLTIAGWVAMWRPMEIYLYEWWPLRRHGQILEKLSRMPIEVRRQTGESHNQSQGAGQLSKS